MFILGIQRYSVKICECRLWYRVLFTRAALICLVTNFKIFLGLTGGFSKLQKSLKRYRKGFAYIQRYLYTIYVDSFIAFLGKKKKPQNQQCSNSGFMFLEKLLEGAVVSSVELLFGGQEASMQTHKNSDLHFSSSSPLL